MIYIDQTIHLLPKLLEPLDEIRLFDYRKLTREELIKDSCTALFFRSTLRVSTHLLEGTSIRFLGSLTSGMDHIASDVIESGKYTITSAKGANANAVAEYVLASILLWCQRYGEALHNQSVGIIGFGNIGRRVAAYLYKLGGRVFLNDPPLAECGNQFPEWAHYTELHQLLTQCTIITAHVPLTHKGKYPTWHLVQSKHLRTSPAKLLIHTSRGGVIGERTLLLYALRRGIALAIDVWENEPNCSPALVQSALIATPHIAGHTLHARVQATLSLARMYYEFCGITFPAHTITLPPRQLITGTERPEMLLTALLSARQFDTTTEHIRDMVRLPRHQRIMAIEHFRATYPLPREVFRTTYDSP